MVLHTEPTQEHQQTPRLTEPLQRASMPYGKRPGRPHITHQVITQRNSQHQGLESHTQTINSL